MFWGSKHKLRVWDLEFRVSGAGVLRFGKALNLQSLWFWQRGFFGVRRHIG